MYFKPLGERKFHISELYTFAFTNTPGEITEIELKDYLNEALEIAEDTEKFQVVDMNNGRYVFFVYPSGVITLYRKEGDYIKKGSEYGN